MQVKIIREKFLNFFSQNHHKIIDNCPIVSNDDPSLMFVNAGINQFKDIILGGKSTYDNLNIANSQPCMRVSGKHNDLEDVGIDTYHHTMFEMLGNWSFGGYFKERAIHLCWKLITEVYKINKDDIYITVFKGSKDDNIPSDSDTFSIWKSIVGEERIFYGEKKDNFWEMGNKGPCGACTEIHFDLRDSESRRKKRGIELVNKGDPNVIELWNLVFIEYNRELDGSLTKLPMRVVDTGMGLERLAMVLQKKKSTYDIDTFSEIISKIETISSKKYGIDNKVDIAIRVCADHIRAICFCISDGQVPSNEGAGYVVRRIIRRAVRYAYSFLGIREPFLYKLTEVVSSQFDYIYKNISSQVSFISNIIKLEEKSFFRTIDRGMLMLEDIINKSNDGLIDGQKVFELYDTYGFPVDLTALILKENDLKLDYDGFESYMKRQRERSKIKSKFDSSDWIVLDGNTKGDFVGYDTLEFKGAKIVRVSGYDFKDSYTKNGFNNLEKKEKLINIVFDKTPFYGESGGQIGDTGRIMSTDGDIDLRVVDTKKENGMIIHIVEDDTDRIAKNIKGKFNLYVDEHRRNNISVNHTVTHILNLALSLELGDHINQKGSFVGDKYLKFDFSHFDKLSHKQIAKIENYVNSQIRKAINLEEFRDKDYSKAMQEGYIGLFSEKYSEKVRCIKFGDSKELCGGTHVRNTCEIGFFRITKESSISAGIRRIEALAGEGANNYLKERLNNLDKINEILKNPKDIVKSLDDLILENKQSRKKIESLENSLLDTEVNKSILNDKTNTIIFLGERKNIGEFKFPVRLLNNLAFKLKNKSNAEGKNLVCVTYVKQGAIINYMILINLVSMDKVEVKAISERLSDFINSQLKDSKGGGSNGLFRGKGSLKEKFDSFEHKLDLEVSRIINEKGL